MKKIIKGRHAYFGIGSSLCLASLAMLVLLCYAEQKPIGFMLFKSNFYIAWAIHTPMAYVVVRLCICNTRVLDYRYPWQRSYAKRWPKQLLMVMLLPLLLSMVLVFAYFLAYQKSLLATSYFQRYLFLDGLFVLLLNAALFFDFQWHQRPIKIPKKSRKPNPDLKWPLPEEKIAYIYAKNKACFAVNFDGEELFWQQSLSKTLPHLSKANFYPLRRSFIVNRKAIAQLVKENQRLQVSLIKPLAQSISVSRSEEQTFKNWWHNVEELPVMAPVEA